MQRKDYLVGIIQKIYHSSTPMNIYRHDCLFSVKHGKISNSETHSKTARRTRDLHVTNSNLPTY